MIRYMYRFQPESILIPLIRNHIIPEGQLIVITEDSIIRQDTAVIRVRIQNLSPRLADIQTER